MPLLLAALGCSAGTSQLPRHEYRELAVAGGRNRPTILVFMPDTQQTRDVWKGLCDEVGQEFRLVAVRLGCDQDESLIVEGVERHRPSAAVLMNNPTVAAYRKVRQHFPRLRGLPAVVVMTSFLETNQLRELGATGISYEVPLITAVTTLRRLMASPVERVGVVFRGPLAPFVERQSRLASQEKVRVLTQAVDAEPNSSEIKRALRMLKQQSDAIWIVNDDRLLDASLIAQAWLPGLNERPWRPTIVGAASLVSTQQSLGTVAVLPDHVALGTQAAGMLFNLAESGWSLTGRMEAQYPLSTTTTLDLPQAKERFALTDGAMAQVDRVLE